MTARIGLVLGAGGVVGGAFHAGVLAALAQATGWDARRADRIVGTSAGSLTGAMLRAGLPPTDLAARAFGEELSAEGQRVLGALGRVPGPPRIRFDWLGSALPPESAGAIARAWRAPWRIRPGALAAATVPEGRTSTEPITSLLEPLFGEKWPERPLWLVAVRLRDARRVVFGRDSVAGETVAHAVAASCAIPGVFAPVTVGDSRYVDGGAHSPTNADLLRGEKLDLVLISSPMSVAGRGFRGALDEPMRRLLRLTLAREVRELRRRRIPVVAFQPTDADRDVMGFNAMDPERRRAVAAQARESTLRRLSRDDVRRRLEPLAE